MIPRRTVIDERSAISPEAWTDFVDARALVTLQTVPFIQPKIHSIEEMYVLNQVKKQEYLLRTLKRVDSFIFFKNIIIIICYLLKHFLAIFCCYADPEAIYSCNSRQL